jgi:hypothetical protein
MIPKASQRAGGDELATHLLNAHQNELIEIAEIRGAIARDPHGAFAEWKFQADALTRCKKYLYSLSISPDYRLGEFTREQYLDYADRVEKALGLSGQPRVLVFHEKEGRLHAHVVWSRIDVSRGKAIHISYDHMKLKQVTIEFARDHGLELPDGYFKKTDASASACTTGSSRTTPACRSMTTARSSPRPGGSAIHRAHSSARSRSAAICWRPANGRMYWSTFTATATRCNG